jgi:translocator protein
MVQTNNWRVWYDGLKKPDWTPSPKTITFIWKILYPVIMVCTVYIFLKYAKNEIPFSVVIPFLLNIIFNIIFAPIQFALRNLWLAGIDAFLIAVTIIWSILEVWEYNQWIAFAQFPYFVWVCIALYLQVLIIRMNKE